MVFFGPLPSTRIGLGTLTANRQTTAMTNATVAANFNQTLDVQTDFTAQVTLNGVAVLDALTQLCCFFLGQILDASIRIDTGLLQNVVRQLPSNAVDIGQSNLYALFTRKVNTGNTCHFIYLQSIVPEAYVAETRLRAASALVAPCGAPHVLVGSVVRFIRGTVPSSQRSAGKNFSVGTATRTASCLAIVCGAL